MLRRFTQCDVFSSAATKGNGLAVVLDAEGLTTEQMQSFARWTNLAETTFVLPPTDPNADYRLRIFTTVREMPFAGHPTLGSVTAWLDSGGKPQNPDCIRQECQIGLVDIHNGPQRPSFVAPPTKIMPMEDATKTAIMGRLGLRKDQILATAELNNGPIWQVFELDGAASVLAVDSAQTRWPEFKSIGLIGAHSANTAPHYEVRMLAPSSGMSEDPITGSLNSALAHWLQSRGRLQTPIVTAQGTTIGREGRVYITPMQDGSVHIGGDVNILIRGEVDL